MQIVIYLISVALALGFAIAATYWLFRFARVLFCKHDIVEVKGTRWKHPGFGAEYSYQMPITNIYCKKCMMHRWFWS